MHASVNEGCQGKSGPGKIHEVILVLFDKKQRERGKKLTCNKDYPTNLKRLDDFNQLNTVSEFFLVFKSG